MIQVFWIIIRPFLHRDDIEGFSIKLFSEKNLCFITQLVEATRYMKLVARQNSSVDEITHDLVLASHRMPS